MLLSERFSVLYPTSVAAHRLARHARWRLSRRRLAKTDPSAVTPHCLVRHGSVLMRRLGDVDMALQRNKVENLRLAIAGIDDRVLRPGDELSFWRCVGSPTASRGFLPGLVLVHGRMATDVGGGLCQLSNLLHWMVLHTTMRVVERHHHGYDSFPDSGRVLPFGSGATVFYNFVDLRIENPGPETYRIRLWLTDDELRGELRVDRVPEVKLHVLERDHRFFRSSCMVYRENRLFRRVVDRRSGRELRRELLAHNVSPVLYEPGPDVAIEEEPATGTRRHAAPATAT
jgi:vancomycin resistance protein VanW